jgi:hypothetical protein
MADFYPVLARAVSRLPIDGPRARHELYDHARAILVAQLRERDPHISVSEIMRQQSALETAIRRVEVDSRPAQIQRPKRRTPPQLTGNRVAMADDGAPSKFDKPDFDEALPVSRASLAHGRSLQTFADWMGSQPEIGLQTDCEFTSGLSGAERPIVAEDNLETMPDIATQIPRAETGDRDVEVPFLNRTVKASPVVADQLHNGIRVRHGRVILDDARAQPPRPEEIAKSKKGRTTSLGGKSLTITLIVVMMAFIVVISIATIPIYGSRLVWLAQHLIDYPNLLIALPIMLCLFVLLLLPFFRKGRTRSAYRF